MFNEMIIGKLAIIELRWFLKVNMRATYLVLVDVVGVSMHFIWRWTVLCELSTMFTCLVFVQRSKEKSL